jgi:hypothetical protein
MGICRREAPCNKGLYARSSRHDPQDPAYDAAEHSSARHNLLHTNQHHTHYPGDPRLDQQQLHGNKHAQAAPRLGRTLLQLSCMPGSTQMRPDVMQDSDSTKYTTGNSIATLDVAHTCTHTSLMPETQPWRVYSNILPLNTTWCTPPSQQCRVLDVHHQHLLPLFWTEPGDVAAFVAVVAVTSVVTSSTSAAARACASVVIVLVVPEAATTAIAATCFFLAGALATTSLPLLLHE